MIPSARVRTSARIKAVIKNQEGSVLLDQNFTSVEKLLEKVSAYLRLVGSLDESLQELRLYAIVTLSPNSPNESVEPESVKP